MVPCTEGIDKCLLHRRGEVSGPHRVILGGTWVFVNSYTMPPNRPAPPSLCSCCLFCKMLDALSFQLIG